MLCLQRTLRADGSPVGRRIFVGDNIIITLVEIDGNSVVIGVTAPKGVPVFREELLTRDQVVTIAQAAHGW